MKKGKKGTDDTGLFWNDLGCKGWYEAYLRSPKKFLPEKIVGKLQRTWAEMQPWTYQALDSALELFYAAFQAGMENDPHLLTVDDWRDLMRPRALAAYQNGSLSLRVVADTPMVRIGDLARWLSTETIWWSPASQENADVFLKDLLQVLSQSRPESEAPEYEGWITVKDATYRYIDRWSREFGLSRDYEAVRKQITRAYGKQIETVGEGKAGRKLNPNTVDAFIGEKIRAERSNRRR